jgi:hypothetical protein
LKYPLADLISYSRFGGISQVFHINADTSSQYMTPTSRMCRAFAAVMFDRINPGVT